MKAIVDTLIRYGGDESSTVRFDQDVPELLPYATLLTAKSAGAASGLEAVCAVYEWQQRPLLFVVDRDAADDDDIISRIRRLLAMRGDAPYLGVVGGGSLTIYQIGLDARPLARAKLAKDSLPRELAATIPYLGNLRPSPARGRWISDVILRLLTSAIDDLITEGMDDGDAISLVGRALFVRFLADRSLLPAQGVPGTSCEPEELFDTKKNARVTSAWLDDTFNGDFLQLQRSVFNDLTPYALTVLGNVLRRAPGGQLQLGWQERWDNLDFAHIPVGVLSQAHERYLSRHDQRKQRREGGYYTPRHIADLMVRASLHPLRRSDRADTARVLDPSCGAGVFLLTAFRELVAEKWRASGIRPDTRTLRSILYRQVTGFDINESALRFAALGLYLLSIELDPNPKPVSKLRFKNLRPGVLLWTGDPGNAEGALGSLGSAVGEQHVGQYDLVIGNPPWSSSTKLDAWSDVRTRVAKIARNRIGVDVPLPNEVMDLPFVWRALEWAKPGAQIAFALHARILFQQGEGMPEARKCLFKALDITGVVNGSELRNSKVWPEVSAPFCLMFATNQNPSPASGFRFTTPRGEGPLNKAGAWRVDVANSETVTSAQVQERPEILKILFRGSRLDLETYDRLSLLNLPSLEQYWRSVAGEERGRPKNTGNGYQRLRNSSRRRVEGDGQPGVDASYLRKVPELSSAGLDDGLILNVDALPRFQRRRIHDPRPRSLFTAPLLIVGESPPVSRGRIRVHVAESDVVFNQSYHGYSASTLADGSALIRYLALVLSSKFALWHALITSGRFGFEREVVEKFVLDKTPIVPFEMLSRAERLRAERLFGAVDGRSDQRAWGEVDSFVASLLKLERSDLQTISDTLAFNLPYSANRAFAESPASKGEVEAFATTVQEEISSWAQRFGARVEVQRVPTPSTSPWQFVCATKGRASNGHALDQWLGFVRAADELSASEIVYVDDANDTLWLGRLNQRRYWSPSQARLAARMIVWRHIDFLGAVA